MKILSVFLSLFLAGTLLHGYSKKIVLGTYSKEINAKKEFDKLHSIIPEYAELQKIAKENDLKIHVRPFGKYYIVVVEPIRDRKVLYTSLNIIKKGFKKAFVSDAPVIEEENTLKEDVKAEQKKEMPLKESEEAVIEVKEEHNISKETNIIEKEQVLESTADKKSSESNLSLTKPPVLKTNKSELSEKTKECITPGVLDRTLNYFSWSYLIFAVLLGLIIYYISKFKKIYDQY